MRPDVLGLRLGPLGIGFSTVSTLRVYHRVGAGRPIRVVWALEEVGAEYELVTMTELEAPAIESYRQREANPEASAQAAARVAKAAGVLDGALSGTPSYLVGSDFSVADIVAGGVLGVGVRLGTIEPSPSLAAYIEALAARPAWQRAASKLGARGPV